MTHSWRRREVARFMQRRSVMSDRTTSKRFLLIGAALLLAAVTGCGDDDRPARPQNQRRYAAGPLPRSGPTAMAPTARQDGADPLDTPDRLAPDPDAADPLAAGPADAADPLASATGPKMPTAHSHWLRGPIYGARVGVRLNGVLLGEFSAPLDRDITMKLREGVNTVTFEYRPLASGASARLDVVESEHTPPIPPLATFRSRDTVPARDAGRSAPAPASTQTVTFIAR